MQAISHALILIAPFYLVIVTGFMTARYWRLDEHALKGLNSMIIYVALPAMFFQIIRDTPTEQLANFKFIALASSATLVVFLIGYGLAKWRGAEQTSASMQGIAASYSNIGYMGPALVISVFGPQAIAPAAIIFVADNALLFTLAPLFVALGGGRFHVLKVLQKILLHPFILATFAGIVAATFELQLPSPIDASLNLLKNAAAPAALFLLGAVIACNRTLPDKVEVPQALLLKLILHPILVYVLLGFADDIEPMWRNVATVMAALPPALNVFVLARQYNAFVVGASSVVLLGTAVSVLSLGAVIAFLTQSAL